MSNIDYIEEDDNFFQDFMNRLDRVMTPEEIKEEKDKEKRRLELKGYLSPADEYSSDFNCSMEVVENNPKRFIMGECIPACQELWSKNIYTFMVSDYHNEGCCWIEVVEDNLSDENKKVFAQLEGEDLIKFSYHEGCINFGVKVVGSQAQSRLLELSQQFQMQDVPYGKAYITVSEYLFNCGCYVEVENPNYVHMVTPSEMNLSDDEMWSYRLKYFDWQDSDISKKTIKVFDESKVAKQLDEYFEGTNVIHEGDRVYLSDYHYQKHLKYINSLNKIQKTLHNQ